MVEKYAQTLTLGICPLNRVYDLLNLTFDHFQLFSTFFRLLVHIFHIRHRPGPDVFFSEQLVSNFSQKMDNEFPQDISSYTLTEACILISSLAPALSRPK